jgi:hypothetical protein
VATTAVLAGTAIYNTPPYAFAAASSADWGSADLAATLMTGDLRQEEFDQYLAEIRYVRGVTIPMVISGGTAAAAVANTLALGQLFATANRYAPVNFVFTPNAGNASTFKVIGGGIEAPWDIYQDNTGYVKDAVLHLQCLPWVYGAPQSFGSSGAPLGGGNQTSPAANTITPSPAGDVPADVTLFTKNRSASAIRSLIAATISGNTTWVVNKAATAWTAGANGSLVSTAYTTTSSDTQTILSVASFTTPTLPSDRRFRLMLRVDNTDQIGMSGLNPASFRVRVITGSTEVIGEWHTPPNFNAAGTAVFLADMGGYMIPVSEVGSLGAGSTTTTVFVEVRGNDLNQVTTRFYEALFLPDDSTIVVETSDTGKPLAAAAATVQLETDQVYDTSGNGAGGAIIGPQLRLLGATKVIVYTSQQYMGNMNAGNGFVPENVDVYFTVTPRYIGLA